MNQAIANIIKGHISGLDFVDKIAGLTSVLTFDMRGPDNTMVQKSFPVACCVTPDECEKQGAYNDLMPNSEYKSVIYLEDGGISFEKYEGNWKYYKSSLRLIAWLNIEKLTESGICKSEIPCTYAAHVITEIIRALPEFPQNTHGPIERVYSEITSQIVRNPSIFSAYTYDEKHVQYLMAPFDYFALEIQTSFAICLSSRATPDSTCIPAIELLPPTELTLTAISDTQIDLAWTNNALNQAVAIERSLNGNDWTEIFRTSAGAVTYSDTELTVGTRYYYRIRAFSGGDYSAYSNVDDVTLLDWTLQEGFITPEFTLINDFDNLGDLTLPANDADKEISTDYFLEGSGSLKVTTHTQSCPIDIIIPAIKFTNPIYGILRVYLPIGSTFIGAGIFVSKTTGYSAGSYANFNSVTYEGVRDQATFKSGWNNIIFNRASFNLGTPALLDDPLNEFVSIRISIAANKGPVYIDSLRIGSLIKSNILVMFDDAVDTTMVVNDAVFGTGKSAFDYMNDNNIQGSIYIISDLVGVAGYLSVAQLSLAYQKGWDLCNHTKTHAIATTLSDVDITNELSACNTFLQSHGWNRGRLHFAYPTGAFTLDTHPALVKSLGYKSGRSIQTVLENVQYKPDNLYHLWAKGVSNTVTAANVTDKIDEAILTGRMFGSYIHALGAVESASTWSPTKFKAVIDHIVTKRTAGLINVLTISEWENSLIKL